jgi:putative ABC transport system permease protein
MSLAQDLRFAARMLVKDRWFTFLAVVALGLGIGVNNTVFTFVNAVLLRGLPYERSERIIHVNARHLTEDRGMGISFPDYEDLKAQTQTLQDLAGYRGGAMNLSDADHVPEQFQGTWVTPNAFGILGQPMHLGRDFRPEDGRPGAEPVVIIGYGVWQTRYGGDPGILGRVVKVNEVPSTIVGVMQQGVKFPTNSDVWQTIVPAEPERRRDNRSMNVFGRLKPGLSQAEARTELTGIASRLTAQYPDTNKDIGVEVMPINDRFNGGPIRIMFLTLMGAVGFVLLIACANVANLLLSRSAHRAREIAVRVALGASRGRIVRQLLVEAVMLGCLGGILGLGLSVIGVRLFDAAVQDVGKPYWIVFTMDALVFGFLAGLCILTGIIFGLAPAVQISKTNVTSTLNETGRSGGAGIRARRFSSSMVVVQLALTIVLLVGAGLMIRSFFKMYNLDLGIRTDRLVTMRLGLAERKYKTQEDRRQFHDRLADRLASTPGVSAAAVASSMPLGGGPAFPLEIDGRPAPVQGQNAPRVTLVAVSPRYFETLELPLRRGRLFSQTDGLPGSETTIVNERFAARFFPNEDPLGKRIKLRDERRDPDGDGKIDPAPWLTIVGIVPSVRQRPPQDVETDSVVYVPYRMDAWRFVTLIARSAGAEPGAISNQLRQEVRAVDTDQPVFNVWTLDEFLARQRWPYTVFGTLFAVFAVIALVLAAVGVYAVTAYTVTQRTQEIGVRMALGAQESQVSWLILRQGMLQLALGVIFGLAGAFGASWLLAKTELIQVTSTDPVTFGGITLLLFFVVAAACLIPARRATRLNPLTALRAD